MFDTDTYSGRRDSLKQRSISGVAVFLGNDETPMNYTANTYHFRQDSTFLYYFGLDSPGLAAVIDFESGEETIFGDDIDIEDIIWMGTQPSMKERGLAVGVTHTLPIAQLEETIHTFMKQGRPIHFLPPYRPANVLKMSHLLGILPSHIKNYASISLVKAVVEQRSIKTDAEVEQIELALDATYHMQTTAMKMARPGVYERDIAGRIEGIALARGGHVSFPIICTVNGQTLHNHYHGNMLEVGQLLLTDCGAETASGYAGDTTRTVPVGGTFSPRQKEIYEIVLTTINSSIESIRPDVKYKEIHHKASEIIAAGLRDLGLMKGDVKQAVSEGAHALFFPHGLGHMMGLDVHDMEDLGENYVGYDNGTSRSDQFGIAYLRLGRELQPGFVLTVEPGIYFIPALIDKWRKENKFPQYIDYKKVETYKNFGGIRIEDDVLVTPGGYRVLGKPIPKAVKDVEAVTATGT